MLAGETTPPPSPPPPPMPGVAIRALATASGCSCFDVATGLAAVLGAIAGPVAGPKSVVGDRIDPAFHLVAAADHCGAWQRLEELLFQPVAACQKKLRALSRLTSVARLDHLQFGRVGGHTDEIVELTKPCLLNEPGVPTLPDYDERHVAALRTPTFYLRAPDEATWAKAQSEIMDAEALVWTDGSIFHPQRAPRLARGSTVPAGELLAATRGCDRYIERDKQLGPGRLDPVKANLFVSTSRDLVTAALSSEDPDVRRLLQTCVFVLPSRDPSPINLKPEYMRAGYEAFYGAVNTVLGLRRNGGGLRLAFKAELSEQIEQSATGTRHWCSTLPPRLQPHFAQITSLPYRLAWACLATLYPGENDHWVAPFVRATVRHVLNKQKEFLEEQMLAAEVATAQRAREVMLRKLARGPCLWRELLRRYSIQRRELHQPVLDALMNEGAVRQRDDGCLELTGVSMIKA